MSAQRQKLREERIKKEEEELEQFIKEERTPVEEKPKEEGEENLSPEEKSFKKRYGDLRAYAQKLEAREKQLAEEIEKLKTGKSKPTDLPLEGEELENWVKNNPDISRLIKSLARQEAKVMVKDYEEKFQVLEKDTRESSEIKVINKVKQTHPDFDTINNSDDFHDWLEDQTQNLQSDYYDSMNPKAITSVITLYKAVKDFSSKVFEEDDRESAKLVKTSKSSADVVSKGKVYSESMINKMSDRDYQKYEDEINESIRNGTFIYDISGSAR